MLSSKGNECMAMWIRMRHFDMKVRILVRGYELVLQMNHVTESKLTGLFGCDTVTAL